MKSWVNQRFQWAMFNSFLYVYRRVLMRWFKLPSERIWLQSSSWVRRPTQMFLDIIPKYDSQIPCLGLVYLCCWWGPTSMISHANKFVSPNQNISSIWHLAWVLWPPNPMVICSFGFPSPFQDKLQTFGYISHSYQFSYIKRISSYRFRTIDMCFGSHFAKRKHCRTPVFHRAWYMFCLGNLNITFK